MIGIDTENLYINAKQKLEKYKENIISQNIKLNQIEQKSKRDQINYLKLTNNYPIDDTHWSHTTFSTYINKLNIECPLISSEEEKSDENINQIESNKKSNKDITNKIYQLNQGINYSKFINSLKIEFELEGQSKFWVFLHCEEKNYNYNHKTAVIIISRDCFNRNFISLNSFVDKNEDNNEKIKINNFHNINADNNYEFIEFKKQELIEENTVKEKIEKREKLMKENNIINNNKNNDAENIEDLYEQKSFYELNIFDDGEMIWCKIKINKGEFINEIKGDFFFPVLDIFNESKMINNNEDNIISLNIKEKEILSNNSVGYKIRIAGSGEKCNVLSFYNELNLKNLKLNDQTYCQCCEIF